jgi:hypothetical protein
MGDTTLISFDDLDVEALAVIANDAAEEVETNARKTVEHAERCGRALLAAKEKTKHGQWLAWVGANFNYSQQTASDYMRIADYGRARNLEEATSVRAALKMISDDPEVEKRESPKKPGVVVTKPAADPAESKDVIDVDSKPVDPKPPKPASNPRSDAAPRNSKQAAPEFDLGSSLDEHRSAILEMAGDYAAAKKTNHFIVMLRKVATDLEATTPGGAN